MDRITLRIRKPVERDRATRYIRLILLSFAATVALVRFFLQLTGYPQLGNGTLHIAHLLWGGLLLFASALVMVIFANHWIYTLGAILAGAGVGLFIDEIGKFITRSNDYFYPPAAPIIYVFFLLVVLVYLDVRRPPKKNTRAELYRAFDRLQEILDRDLDAEERLKLETSLHEIASQEDVHPDFSRLAKELLHFLHSRVVTIAPHHSGWFERPILRVQNGLDRWMTRNRLRTILVGGLVVLGGVALLDPIRWLIAVQTPGQAEVMLGALVTAHRVIGARTLIWFTATLGLKAGNGVLLIAAAGFLAAGKDKPGFRFAYLGLLIGLTIVDLMDFYFMQFATILPAILHFVLLIGVLTYRRRGYLPAQKRETAISNQGK